MAGADKWTYRDEIAALTTMHAKERVIAPVLYENLGLIVERVEGLNTDKFGAFSREIERTGTQLDAARAKIAAGFERAPRARVGLASEGSFGPHPQFPFVAIGRELVLMIDRETGLELSGYDASPDTNFAHLVVHGEEEAHKFAEQTGFPEHGLIVSGWRDERPAPDAALSKDLTTADALTAAVRRTLHACDAALVETDMRAHRNPTRMRAIERATRDLARRFQSRCPGCGWPGFDVTERIAGLPCAWCGEPTRVTMTEVLTCEACRHRQERPAYSKGTADAGSCDFCNP